MPVTEQRVAVVTGGASGIGAATARAFGSNGYAVHIIDRDDAEPVAAEIRAGGAPAGAVQADVASASDVAAAVAAGVESFGRIDSVVNCAGIDGAGEAVADLSEEDIDRVLGINLKGTMFVVQHAVRHMQAQGTGGAIVNIASATATIGVPNLSVYSASKGAVISFTRALAVELARDSIRVNAICPGVVRTGMMARSERFTEEDVMRAVRRHPIPRIADAAELANVAFFLGSPSSSFMTGSIVLVDGGQTVM
jgi:NAD(P)-dependent dehydrogenase (short-subunit alcohol dehydrogenase family)